MGLSLGCTYVRTRCALQGRQGSDIDDNAVDDDNDALSQEMPARDHLLTI